MAGKTWYCESVLAIGQVEGGRLLVWAAAVLCSLLKPSYAVNERAENCDCNYLSIIWITNPFDEATPRGWLEPLPELWDGLSGPSSTGWKAGRTEDVG